MNLACIDLSGVIEVMIELEQLLMQTRDRWCWRLAD